MKLGVKRLHEDSIIPKYATSGSAGFDLHAVNNYVLMPGEIELVCTGLSFNIPVGYELQIRPRSGLSAKSKLRIANSPGTIDSDYKGEVKIIIENLGSLVAIIDKGDRVAQAVLAPVIQAEIVEVDDIGESERSSGGFGSTGV